MDRHGLQLHECCRAIHYKKAYCLSRPQQECHLPNSACPGIIKLFLARETLVSDIIPAKDRENDNLFYSVPTTLRKY
jgi:hypothetical protein